MNNSLWWLNNGYSRHMLGNKRQFKKFKSLGGGLVSFRDGSTSTIKGRGSIDIPDLPTFHNIFFL